jgi:nucleotide-binding universal stress UspA family protein
MNGRLLVAVESLETASGALSAASRIAQDSDMQLRLVHLRVWDRPTPQGGGRFYPRSSQDATSALDQAMQFVWGLGSTASGVVVDAPRSDMAAAILAEAETWGADVVVVPAPSRNRLNQGPWDRAIRRVARRSRRPVLVTRP